MSYGTLAILLILFGFQPLEVIPAVIFATALLSTFAGFLHHRAGNVKFNVQGRDIKVVLTLAIFGIIGIIIGVFIAGYVSTSILKTYIGFVVTVVGMLILARHRIRFKFSWPKIVALGSIAAFNKGMTGGGYGPFLSGGQILAGVHSKRAVGITALTEGIVSTFGILAYFLTLGINYFNPELILALVIGGFISTPLAVHSVKRIKRKHLRTIIGLVSIILGIATLSIAA
jgi:uncharacterized membrane protein YfcA